MKMHFGIRAVAATFAAVLACEMALAQYDGKYYVGIDGRTDPYTAPDSDGGGAYPDNPNNGRLTLLLSHGNHYHGIGSYRYSGPSATPTLNSTNANNRLPEGYTLQAPLALTPGAGVYAGRNVLASDPGVEYSDLEIQNVHVLANTGIAEVDALYHSSSNRWDGPFDAADIHLELVGTSSPWLNVGSPTDPSALPVGGDIHLGEGDEMFSFTPVLWVDESAPAGDYWAEFRLTDPSGAFGDSGSFFIDVQQVPEPTTALLTGLGLLGAATLTRRSR